MRTVVKFAAIAGLAIAVSGVADAKALKFGHVGEPGSLFAASADEFARVANERLPEGYTVEVFGASQLGKDKELLQKLKLGQVEFALPSSIMSSVAEAFGVFEMPYIIQSRDHMKAVEAEIFEDVLQAEANEEGFRILALWENGFRHITNNVRPINTPEDLAGVKLRTPNGEWRVKMFQSYGANPTPMAFSDVFTALQTGVIDGQENPYAQIASAKFQEVQKYLSITGHVYTPAYVLVSESHFAALPEDVQAILTEAAMETQQYVYDEAARLETTLLDEIKAAGVEVNTADKQAFIAASAPIYEEFATTIDGGAELVTRVQSVAPTN